MLHTLQLNVYHLQIIAMPCKPFLQHQHYFQLVIPPKANAKKNMKNLKIQTSPTLLPLLLPYLPSIDYRQALQTITMPYSPLVTSFLAHQEAIYLRTTHFQPHRKGVFILMQFISKQHKSFTCIITQPNKTLKKHSWKYNEIIFTRLNYYVLNEKSKYNKKKSFLPSFLKKFL